MEKFNPPPMMYREEGRSVKFSVEEIIEETENSVKVVLERLKDGIDQHEFGGLLGVDGSGRIPALILWKTINTIYKNKNDESELFLNFIQGLRSGREERGEDEIKKYLNSIRDNLQGKKLLIVDDTIDTGGSLKIITSTLNQLGIECITIVLGVRPREHTLEDLEEEIGTTIINGANGVATVYGKRRMSGVKKDVDSIFSVPYYKESKGQNKKLTIPSSSDYPQDKTSLQRVPEPLTYTDYDIVARTRTLTYAAASRLAKYYSENNV